jgi:hypothetical protein
LPPPAPANSPTDLDALKEYFTQATYEDEPADAVESPEEALFGEETKRSASTSALTTAQIWKLTVRTRTPDIKAFEKLLGTRYGQDSDDVEHVDPFAIDP